MKITVVAPFPENNKSGIPRVSEELIKRLCESNNVESIAIIAHKGFDHVNPSLLETGKVMLFSGRMFLLPWTLLKTIKLYKHSDVFLVLTTPWDVFDQLRPLYFLLFLVNYGFRHRILPRSKWVQMLHDFVIYVCPEDNTFPSREMKLYEMWKECFLTVPIKYVAVSESTKRDAVRYWGLPADKIEVIHLGSFVPAKRSRTRFNAAKILTISDITPRKNHIRLIEAFEKVYRTNPSDDLELIIVGHVRKNVPEFEEALSDIRRRNEGIKITICGYLTDSEILSLYEQADVFVYPSLYEGFGLPVLEAMACGCPVIASNISSLPEVVGDAGMLIDPYDTDQLAQAIITVLGDDELKREMSRKGIAQAQKFSWEKAEEQWVTTCRLAKQE
ncbi:MAG: glycosyltransferase family 4 protein [Halobacteriota archaeon]